LREEIKCFHCFPCWLRDIPQWVFFKGRDESSLEGKEDLSMEDPSLPQWKIHLFLNGRSISSSMEDPSLPQWKIHLFLNGRDKSKFFLSFPKGNGRMSVFRI
jgi:hypothetical protein